MKNTHLFLHTVETWVVCYTVATDVYHTDLLTFPGPKQLGRWHRTRAGPTGSFHSGTNNAKKQHPGRSIQFPGAAMAECQGLMAVLVEASGFCGGCRSVLTSQSPGIISADHPGCLITLISTVLQPSYNFCKQPNSPPMHVFAI